jgi:hypothetical protein
MVSVLQCLAKLDNQANTGLTQLLSDTRPIRNNLLCLPLCSPTRALRTPSMASGTIGASASSHRPSTLVDPREIRSDQLREGERSRES